MPLSQICVYPSQVRKDLCSSQQKVAALKSAEGLLYIWLLPNYFLLFQSQLLTLKKFVSRLTILTAVAVWIKASSEVHICSSITKKKEKRRKVFLGYS